MRYLGVLELSVTGIPPENIEEVIERVKEMMDPHRMLFETLIIPHRDSNKTSFKLYKLDLDGPEVKKLAEADEADMADIKLQVEGILKK